MGRPGTHQRAAVVDGEVAAGLQEVGDASGGSSKSRGADSCSRTGLSSFAGAP
jgi:hypothetical protein